MKNYKCKCNKVFDNSQKFNGHKRWCIIHNNGNINKNGGGWNKGLTKLTDSRMLDISQKNSVSMIGKNIGRKHTEATKKIMSKKAKERGWDGNNRRKSIYYTKTDLTVVRLDSSYEKIVAEQLDLNKIEWARPKYLKWIDDNKIEHRYYPDFYLPEYDVYLDPKNDLLIKRINPRFGITDVEKINRVCKMNNVKVVILTKHELLWDKIIVKIA